MNERIKELIRMSGGDVYEGFCGSPDSIRFNEKELERFAALVAAAEREECAKVCEGLKSPLKEADRYFNNGCNASAKIIRARGEK